MDQERKALRYSHVGPKVTSTSLCDTPEQKTHMQTHPVASPLEHSIDLLSNPDEGVRMGRPSLSACGQVHGLNTELVSP